jgi:hypothetical protein
MKFKTTGVASLVALIGFVSFNLTELIDLSQSDETKIISKSSALKLKQKYEQWKVSYEKNQGAEILSLPLHFSKAYSNNRTATTGETKLNLVNGELQVKLNGLEVQQRYNFWLVGGLKSDKQHEIEKNIGSFTAKESEYIFTAQLDRTELNDFFIRRLVLNRADQESAKPAELVASPSLFQRLYYANLLWPITGVGHVLPQSQHSLAFGFLLPKPAFADALHNELEVLLGEQIALGRDLFINETFDGNGRTCITCHRLDNNHTIDPKFIATLEDDDPLFVAEFNPQLSELENPQLMRQLGMILTNVDGFDNPDVFRGVPHMLALMTSIGSEDRDAFIANAVGWSGDGAPGTGSLREFTEGAVKQHFPLTLAREADVDFRLPTADELDAMEAYMLSVGRQEDIVLADMNFSSPIVERGKELFDTKQNPVDPDTGEPIFGQTANCNGCHENAGANSSSTKLNPTRDTGAENQPDQPARLLDPNIAVDGGFGVTPRNDCGVEKDQPCFGDARFNSAPLIEAADTGPFFHNNSAGTIEQAISFYTGDAFNNSPGSLTGSGKNRQIKLDASQVTAIALFLRTLNAMENIRSANELDAQVIELSKKSGRKILKLAMAETIDAIEVLEDAQFISNPEALKKLQDALELQGKAMKKSNKRKRNKLLYRAIHARDEANELFLVEPVS